MIDDGEPRLVYPLTSPVSQPRETVMQDEEAQEACNRRVVSARVTYRTKQSSVTSRPSLRQPETPLRVRSKPP